jgi:catechol 2,3-dioxygenase-like lactoylglutathione lyase family enzyme
VTGFDHVVLAVADVERSLAWYTDVVGLAPVRVEEWRRGDAPFPSVRVSPTTIIDLIPKAADGNVDHFCLVADTADTNDLTDWAAGAGLTVLDGPGPRFGARGVATSIYVKDPDGNTVEFRHYSPA